MQGGGRLARERRVFAWRRWELFRRRYISWLGSHLANSFGPNIAGLEGSVPYIGCDSCKFRSFILSGLSFSKVA